MIALDKKKIEIILEEIPEPVFPNEKLEQYPTPSWIVAEILWNLKLKEYTIKYKVLFDLGSGTGRICIGGIMVGFKECIAIDIDENLLKEMEKTRLYKKYSERINPVRGDVSYIPFRRLEKSIVLMNPPFGIKRKGMDTVFLDTATKISNRIISVHLYNEKSILYLKKSVLFDRQESKSYH